jgi:APA family basic amino acid/polyamine antiporter
MTGQRRSLGLWMCTALVVGNMIGSGVFLLPASLAPYGGISIVGWLVSGGGAICLALVFARLGTVLPLIGGPYAYAREGFGDFGGFWIAWSYWIAILLSNAALAVAFTSYATVFWPALATTPALAGGAALGTLWALTLISIAGVREAGRVQVVTTVLKILPLLAVGTLGFLAFHPAHFRPFNPSGMGSLRAVSVTVTLTLWAFTGLESGTVPAEDVADASRTIPRATVLGTLAATLVYVLGTVAVMGIVPRETLGASNAPFADAAQSLWGTWGRGLVAAGAAVSCLGALNGWVLLSGQLPRAAALDGLLPARLARLNGRGAPAVGLVISSAFATVIISLNYTKGLVSAFTFLAVLATLTTLLPYVFSSMTALRVALREGAAAGQRTAAGRLAVAAVAFLYSLWAIAGSGQDAIYWGFLLLVAGLPVYIAMRRHAPGGGSPAAPAAAS